MPITRAEISVILEDLCARWPKAFAMYQRGRRPLQIGVHMDILAQLAIEPKLLSAPLRCYCAATAICLPRSPGAARIDLDGEPVDTVRAEDVERARARLAAIKAAKNSITTQPEKEPPVPVRAGLATA